MNNASQAIIPLEKLIEATRKHLLSLNYAKDTLRHMDQSWSSLTTFAKARGVERFTTEFGHLFLKEKYGIEPFENLRTSFRRNLRRSVMILSEAHIDGYVATYVGYSKSSI